MSGGAARTRKSPPRDAAFSVRLSIGVIAFTSTFGLSCSSDSGNDQKKQDAALEEEKAFSTVVNNATRPWGMEAAGKFFDKVTQKPSARSEAKAFNEAGIAPRLCEEVQSFEPDPDSNGDFDSRSDSIAFVKTSAFDSAVAGLLQHALADPSQRDQRLAALEVGQSVNQTKNPIESMTGAGILDASGTLVIPPTEHLSNDPGGPYERFKSWITRESPALLQSGSALRKGLTMPSIPALRRSRSPAAARVQREHALPRRLEGVHRFRRLVCTVSPTESSASERAPA